MRARRRDPSKPGPSRAPLLFVHTDDQWEALASEPRHEIMQFLGAIGPASIAELAHAMNAPPDGLYHHVRKLLRAGLIRSVGPRHTGRRPEAVYDLVAERLRFDFDVLSGRNADRLRAMLRARLNHASRNFDRALAARELRLEEPLIDSLVECESSWLDDDSFQRVLKHLQSAVQIMGAGKGTRRGRLFSLAIVMNPLVRSRRGDARPTRRLAEMRAGLGPDS
ncbi:MAG: helix-turn-helix transcriptional regulator [Phycisphaerae bacterium]|nr:helix-turn-helix transcriptional regulator [Phycisphaerae bacterium]